MKTKSLIRKLRKLSPDSGPLHTITIAYAAANRLEMLSVELKKLHTKLALITAERDAAIADLERAEEKAQEAGSFLDDVIHPTCEYSIYTAAHDLVSDIVHWEHDDVWRGAKDINVPSKFATDINVGTKEENHENK